MTTDRRKRFRLDRKPEPRRKTYCSHQSQLVFLKPPVRLADGPNHASLQVVLPADKIQYFAGLWPHEQAVDGEVPPLNIMFRRLDVDDLFWTPSIGIVAVGAKRGNLHFKSVTRYEHNSELCSDRNTVRKQCHHLIGQSVGRDVVVDRRPA